MTTWIQNNSGPVQHVWKKIQLPSALSTCLKQKPRNMFDVSKKFTLLTAVLLCSFVLLCLWKLCHFLLSHAFVLKMSHKSQRLTYLVISFFKNLCTQNFVFCEEFLRTKVCRVTNWVTIFQSHWSKVKFMEHWPANWTASTWNNLDRMQPFALCGYIRGRQVDASQWNKQ